MTFTAQGSSLTWDTGNPSFTPHAVGDLVVAVFITKLATTPSVTGLSSSNVTWTKVGGPYTGTLSSTNTTVWIGKVTSVTAATQTITWSGGSEPAHWQADVRQFTVTHGDWKVDKISGFDHNTSNNAYPSLTPNAAGELYYGSHYDDSGASVGSTSGYTYVLDSHGNGMLFNANCGSGAQAPTWADSTVFGGAAVLIQERVSGTAAVALKKMVVAGTMSDNSVTQNLFGTTDPGISSASDASDYTMAMEFEVSANAPLTGIRFWSAPDATGLPIGTAIFNLDTSAIVSGTQDDTPSWSGAAGSGWVQNDYDGSVILQSGTHYAVAILKDSTIKVYSVTANYWVTGGPGASGRTNGVISAPNSASTVGAVGQDQFHTGGGWVKPDSTFNDSNYWIDVEVRVAPSGGDSGTAAVTLKKMTVAGTAVIKVLGTAPVTLKKMTVAGTATAPLLGTAAVTLKKIVVSGSSSSIVSGTSAVTLKKMTVSGTATAPLIGAGSVTLKKMTVASASSSSDSGTAAATLKKVTASGSGFTRISGTGAPKLRKMTVVGIGKAKVSATIVVNIRKMNVSGSGHSPIPGTIAIIMPKMQVSASDGHVVQASSLFIFMQP